MTEESGHMASDNDPYRQRPAPHRDIDIHIHRGPDRRRYADEPLPGEVAAATGLSLIHALLVVVLLILIAMLIASLLGAVSVSDLADGLRNSGGETDTPAQPAQ